jgi:hypothetical protein
LTDHGNREGAVRELKIDVLLQRAKGNDGRNAMRRKGEQKQEDCGKRDVWEKKRRHGEDYGKRVRQEDERRSVQPVN